MDEYEMDEYESMDGLEFGELSAWIDMEMIKDTLVAAAAGGTGLMLGSWAINKGIEKIEFLSSMEAPNQKRVKGGLQILLGLLAGRFTYDYSREAAMGLIGGLGSVGAANLITSFLEDDTAKAWSFAQLPDEMELSSDASLLSDYDEGMEALASLEATGVSTAPGAFADPTVTPEALMGLGGLAATVSQEEQLGAYAPYLS